jgi:hypothetical protein
LQELHLVFPEPEPAGLHAQLGLREAFMVHRFEDISLLEPYLEMIPVSVVTEGK